MRLLKTIIPLLVLALLVSACGPATPNNAPVLTDSGHRFKLALPRLVIDFDEQGQASLLGLSAAELEAIAGMPAGTLSLDPEMVASFVDAGIQHVELLSSDNGLFVFVNGEPLPNLSWDGETLSNAATVANMFDVPFAALIELFAPLIERTGLSIALRFPATGDVIPLRDLATLPENAIAEDEIEITVIIVDVDFDANGVPMIAGVSTSDMSDVTGVDLAMTQLDSATLSDLQAAGVKELQFLNRPDGVFINVNGMALPNISWNTERLTTSIDLYAVLQPDSPYLKVANVVVPQIDNANIDLLIRFP